MLPRERKDDLLTDRKNESTVFTEKTYSSGFGGIRRLCNGAKNTCLDVQNLRLLPDGTLAGREGFSTLLDLTDAPRAVWSGSVMGEEEVYVLVGTSLLFADLEAGTTSSAGTVTCAAGDADIFWHGGDLYVLDGAALRRRSGGTLGAVSGYVPLWGDGWDPALRGPVCEPINYLSPHLRIRFRVSEAPGLFRFGIKLHSIDRLVIDGADADLADYSPEFTAGLDGITVSGFPADCEATFFLTPDASVMPAGPGLCTRAVSLGGPNDVRLCLYGGTNPSDVYFSRPVTEDGMAWSREVYSDSLPLYFPEDGRVTVGEGRHPVTAICRYRDRALLFTAGDAWCLDWNGHENDPAVTLPQIHLVSAGIGCSVSGAAALCGDDPVTVFGGQIWRWHSPSGVRSECTASCISEGLGDFAGTAAGLCTSMLALPARREVWFSCPESSDGRVFVYNRELDAWVTFTGVSADRLFLYGTDAGFLRGEEICLFSPENTADREWDQELAIPVSVSSPPLDFGDTARFKEAVEVEFNATGNVPVELTLADDHYDADEPLTYGCAKVFTLTPSGCTGYAAAHVPTGRFRTLRFTLRSFAGPGFALHGIRFRAR